MNNIIMLKLWKDIRKTMTSCGIELQKVEMPIIRSIESRLMNGSLGKYFPYDHVILLDSHDTSSIATLCHEMVHANQRRYLLTQLGRDYKHATPYEERWYEKQAYNITILIHLIFSDPSFELRMGDHKRVHEYNGYVFYQRSLRKRINTSRRITL